jgi:hypothetical protein
VDLVKSFLGRDEDLVVAIDRAQTAANAWLAQHQRAVTTVYSVTSQSVWHEHALTGIWHHVITLAVNAHEPSGGAIDAAADPPA